MKPEDEETARRLIGDAMADAMADAPTIDTLPEMLELIARSLRDEADLMETLRAGQSALVALTVHHLGQHSETKHAGMLGMQVLTYTQTSTPTPLLDHLNGNDDEALGLVTYAEPEDDDAALMLVIATPHGEVLGAVAKTTGDKEVGAFSIPREEIAERIASGNGAEMARTFAALAQAATRRPQ